MQRELVEVVLRSVNSLFDAGQCELVISWGAVYVYCDEGRLMISMLVMLRG